MERIRPLEPPYEEETAEELRKIMPPGMEPLRLFRILANNPRVLSRVRRGGLLDPGSIPLRARELVILRTTALCGAEYEWGVHAALFGAAAELSNEEICATVEGDLDRFEAQDSLLLELCDALHEHADVDDELWRRLSLQYRPEQLIEIVMLAGQYHAISYLVNALAIDREPWAARFTSSSRS